MADNPDPKQPFTPDPIFIKIDQLLAQMETSIHEVRQALFVVAQIPPDDMAEHETRAKRSNLVATVMSRLMAGTLPGGFISGRWHRRDGDAYGIVRQPGEPNPEKADADDQAGDLRSTR